MIIYQNNEHTGTINHQLSLRVETPENFGDDKHIEELSQQLLNISPNGNDGICYQEILQHEWSNIPGMDTKILVTVPTSTIEEAIDLAEKWATKIFKQYNDEQFYLVLEKWACSLTYTHNNLKDEVLFNNAAKKYLKKTKSVKLEHANDGGCFTVYGVGQDAYDTVMNFKTWAVNRFNINDHDIKQNTTQLRIINGFAHQYEKKLNEIACLQNSQPQKLKL